MVLCLCGTVTEQPPKLSSFHIGLSTNLSTVSKSAREVCGNVTAANALPCNWGLPLYAMFCLRNGVPLRGYHPHYDAASHDFGCR
jgi:hypothetical protein